MTLSEKLFYAFCGLTPVEERVLQLEKLSVSLEPEYKADWITEAFLPDDSAMCREDICTFQERRVD